MENKQTQKPRRWLKIASYIGLGLLALETALLVGAGVVACSDKGKETIASDGVRITTPVVKPLLASSSYNGTTWTFSNDLALLDWNLNFAFMANNDDFDNYYAAIADVYEVWYTDTLNDFELKVYTSASGWLYPHYQSITLLEEPSNEVLSFLQSNATIQSAPETSEGSSSESSSDSESSDSVTEDSASASEVTLNLPSTYDFRRLVANVDPATGCLSLESRWDSGVGFRNFVFPFDWTAGDGKRYNYIYLNVIGLDSSNTLIINGNGDAKLASNVFGENWSKFSMLMNIRYGFDANYSGEYIETYNQQLSLNPSYTAKVYSNTLVSGSLDGQGVAGYDCRAVTIPAMYRYFESGRDTGAPFSTPNYSNVTTGELLNMDLNSIVVLGDVSTSPMSMLSQGFNAIASILSIQLLPNVTLGLLLFIPLIVTVILVIVRLLQK